MSILINLNILVWRETKLTLMVTAVCPELSDEKWDLPPWLVTTGLGAGGDHIPTRGPVTYGARWRRWRRNLEQSWYLQDCRAIIILFSAAAKSPSAIKTFCGGTRHCLWIRNAWHKVSHWSKWVLDPPLADPNSCFEQSAPRWWWIKRLSYSFRRWQIFDEQ